MSASGGTPTITLITGGNKGIGFETARQLKQAGHDVYIGVRDTGRGAAAAESIGVGVVALEVTDESSVKAAADFFLQTHGHIDVLVNNAGIAGPIKDSWDYTGADAETVFATNLIGVVRVTNAFLPLLKESSSPVIVNVSSGTGSFSLAQNPQRIESHTRAPLYAASKAALNMLTLRYAQLLPRVRVNAVDPGFTATDLNGNTGTQTTAEAADAIVKLALTAAHGPNGTFSDRHGPLAW